METPKTDDYQITGGKPLSGSIAVNTSKNGALHLICTALLNQGTTTLHRIPRIAEVERMIEFLASIGVSISWVADNSLAIKPPATYAMDQMNQESASRMRSSIMAISALSHFLPDYELPHAGGCKMGDRTIAAHKYGLEPFGISISTGESAYQITTNGIQPAEVTLYEASDTGTTNLMRAAALAPGTSVLHFATQNYMVQDTMGLLRAYGVVIEQVGPASLAITGVSEINQDVEYSNSEDPIEAMAFLTAGLVTQSELTVTGCPLDFLRLELLKLAKMQAKFIVGPEYKSTNGFTTLVDITVHPSQLVAPADKLHPLPYPGINVDNLPFFVPLAGLATGRTLIHDWMWENRAIYYTYLNQLGADITLADPHRVLIDGVDKFRANQIVCPPALRPSMIILIAMLGAPGTSILRNVYSIKRGYEKLPERLATIGAEITEI